jgi:hypothetical protein
MDIHLTVVLVLHFFPLVLALFSFYCNKTWITTNPTVMVIQQWSKQSFYPHHPGGVSDTAPWFVFFLQIYWENAVFQCKKKGLFTHIVTCIQCHHPLTKQTF